jgi:hypothetical protein
MTGIRSLNIAKEQTTTEPNQTYIDVNVVSQYISHEKLTITGKRIGKIGKVKLASSPHKKMYEEQISKHFLHAKMVWKEKIGDRPEVNASVSP